MPGEKPVGSLLRGQAESEDRRQEGRKAQEGEGEVMAGISAMEEPQIKQLLAGMEKCRARWAAASEDPLSSLSYREWMQESFEYYSPALEALRASLAEVDQLRQQVEQMRPVVEAAVRCRKATLALSCTDILGPDWQMVQDEFEVAGEDLDKKIDDYQKQTGRQE